MNAGIPEPLWRPTGKFVRTSNLHKYMNWLNQEYGHSFLDYHSLWQWSVTSIASFWESIWHYFNIESTSQYQKVLSTGKMPDVRWFEGAKLNYAQHILRNAIPGKPAIYFQNENLPIRIITWDDLARKVASLRHHLVNSGVMKGDRVAAYLPNIPEATIAFLAVNSIGAIWSSCSPDFGTSSVIERFSQIEPRVFITVDGYQYNGKRFDRKGEVKKILDYLTSVDQVIFIPYLNSDKEPDFSKRTHLWDQVISNNGEEMNFEHVPFNHPIWVLYSSGTTGKPKAITHSHGGMLLEHLKYLSFHNDVKQGENCFWYTTTGWMMWNYIQASLLCGGAVVQYDGSPAFPDLKRLWRFTEEIPIHHFGTSAAYVVANMKAGLSPGKEFDLSALRSIGSTGSPLPPEAFKWIYSEVKKELWLTSISGGTDVCTAFVGGNPMWPVFPGEIQCRALGCAVDAFDENGNSVTGDLGEMVITQPMPCMPIYFWNDEKNRRYNESYFEMFPGTWRHGDWIMITPRNGIVIHGRSDATLNRGGIRIGTSEVYSAVDKIKEVVDCLIVSIEKKGGEFYMPLYVQLQDGLSLNDEIRGAINNQLRNDYTPRHVPDEIIQVTEIPYTISGKKMETPVKRILMGMELKQVMSTDAMRNPEAIRFFLTQKI